MRRAHALVFALFTCAACGPLDDLIHGRKDDSSPIRPHAVQAWQGSQQLAANKATVVAACHQAGASDATVSLVLAFLMQETTDADASQRDASKDSAGDSKNWSAFNMNSAFLKKIGWQEGQGPDLNDQANLGAATGWMLKGLSVLGEDGTMNFHRGGQSGYENDQLYGCCDFRAQIREVQGYLMAHREAWTNGQRIGGFLPHV